MNDFLMKPKIDFAFKEIMADPLSRIGFLSAVLKLDPGEIKETHILNTNLRKLHTDEKQGILDVRILMNDHTEINIEIQLSELKVWAERSLFYLSKIFTEQIHEGQSYDVFKKCVSISILNFTLFPKEPEFYSCFRIMEEKRHTIYTDKMEFHVIELPKLPKEWKDENQALLLWAKFINAEKKEEFEMLAEKNTYINHAYQQLQIISQDKEKRLEYEAREKAIRDYNQLMYESEQKGIQQGMQQGIQQGIQQGVQQGMQQAIKIITLDYLSDHLPKEKILIKLQQLFNLTEEQSEQYYQTFAADSHLS
ncbi:MAG: Rpn family recombination-promoting nuclease/putative transposase [Lachnospiraceae bacterium]|nr:Rpn family recombination-promoting nuclease/putative transposase [Lachnospiraceae bacterium]